MSRSGNRLTSHSTVPRMACGPSTVPGGASAKGRGRVLDEVPRHQRFARAEIPVIPDLLEMTPDRVLVALIRHIASVAGRSA
jgi:hypothetical protein